MATTLSTNDQLGAVGQGVQEGCAAQNLGVSVTRCVNGPILSLLTSAYNLPWVLSFAKTGYDATMY